MTLTEDRSLVEAHNLTDPHEDPTLLRTVVRLIFGKFRVPRHMGAIVETESNIPIAVGLKSSSAASNAIALATLEAIGKKGSGNEAIGLGVDASLRAGVTLTGAYDDACACYLGGLVATDNTRRRILKHFRPRDHARVLIYVPKGKKYTKDIDAKQLRNVKPFVEVAHREALRGNYWFSLTLNGLVYSNSFGCDTTPARQALHEGALAAGLSGKGPAVAAVVPSSKVGRVRSVWSSLPGRIIDTSFNFERAKVLEVTN